MKYFPKNKNRYPLIMQVFSSFFPIKNAYNSNHNSVWIFEHFSVTQILREINFDEVAISKTAILTTFKSLKFQLLKMYRH